MFNYFFKETCTLFWNKNFRVYTVFGFVTWDAPVVTFLFAMGNPHCFRRSKLGNTHINGSLYRKKKYFFLNVASVWPKSRNERKSSYFYINSCRELSQDTNIIHTSVCKLALQFRKVEPHLLWIQSNDITMENLLAQLPEEII